MRASMSVPCTSTRADGAPERHRAASVYASAPYEQPALQQRIRPAMASSGMTVRASRSNCSGLRQSWETLIVTRSRNRSS